VSSTAPPLPLAHPLPAGMRDLLPEEAGRRRDLSRRLLEHFALHGYQLVTPPPFEFAEVLERGLGTLDPADVLRFVEPESGEVAALRPDMTPQVARMVATRLGREPRPIRLCYEGTVVRRRQGRARRHRQLNQAGVELYGSPSNFGDVEILRLMASSARSAGLTDFVVDLGHASIARTLLEPLRGELATAVSDALRQKDPSRIASLLEGATRDGADAPRIPASVARALVALPDLHGGDGSDATAVALFHRAEPLLASTGAEGPLGELRALWEAARRASPELAAVLRLDLGEVRGFAYYTGAIYHLLAPGPGEPIGAGGRYDDLLARFDAPMPAVGFALHLDAIAWALEAAGAEEPVTPAALVVEGDGAGALAEALRARGIAAALHPREGAAAYASAWRFTHVLTPSVDGTARFTLSRVDGPGGALRDELTEGDPEALSRSMRGALSAPRPDARAAGATTPGAAPGTTHEE
jgi:ATP phosphoribosyltransferase regulatory subunit